MKNHAYFIRQQTISKFIFVLFCSTQFKKSYALNEIND